MVDQKTEFEIGLKDTITPALRQISKQLKEMNQLARQSGDGGAASIEQLRQGHVRLAFSARNATRDFTEMGKSVLDFTKDIFGIGGVVETVRQVSSAFVDFAKGRVTLRNFAQDTRLTTHDIIVMRRAMEYMGTSADTADGYITALTGKLQQLRAFKESSTLFQDLTKMGEKGNIEAQLLLSDTQRGDYKKGIMDILDFYKSQGPRQQFYLSQILGVPQSILEGLGENMRKVQDVYEGDDKAAQKAYENWIRLKHRWSDEWDRFSDHAISQINDFWDKMEAQSGRGHALSDWANAEFDRTVADAKQAKEDWTKLFGNVSTFLKTETNEGVMAKVDRYLEKPKGSDAEEHDVKDESKKTKSFLQEIRESISRLVGISPGPEGADTGEAVNGGPSGIRAPGGAAQASKGGFRPERGSDVKTSDDGDTPPSKASPSGGAAKIVDQSGHPYYLKGDVTLGGKTYHYGSGGAGAGAIPFGTYPINIGKGDIGPIGQRIGSVATLGGPSGTFTGGGHNWAGVQIHRAFSDRLDHLYTLGCFSIAASEWPAFKRQLLEENARHPEGLNLTVDRNGMASITPRGSTQELVPAHAQDPTSTSRPTSDASDVKLQRNKIDQSDKLNKPSAAISFDFKNVPRGVKTETDARGMFDQVSVNRTAAPRSNDAQSDTLSRWGVR
jgi:hypothetical protein